MGVGWGLVGGCGRLPCPHFIKIPEISVPKPAYVEFLAVRCLKSSVEKQLHWVISVEAVVGFCVQLPRPQLGWEVQLLLGKNSVFCDVLLTFGDSASFVVLKYERWH